ncbi:hypothetical protein [Prevotella sp. E13-27]|uniref:hypothetical protein n=2 Tax=Prevotella sp. E13-27 TaxID=2938122 RepID=UPI00200A70E1|nr:hypothetical protein [Prevotella sp. E13-27]MCK8620772.1 hypothetical protein [Prevotella sp. E13-27]MCK8622446.1 hypothetical protein [Prevotella sp. E13-27]
MLTETGNIKTDQEHLTILPNVDLGIGRIRKLLCWSEEHEPSALAPYLPCLFEYIAFSEGVVIPFFQVLHANLKKHIYSLYVYLRDNGKEPESFLTHDEAFDFLCTLGHTDTRNIIDHYNRLPSNVYTSVINSIQAQDKTAFIAALKETDCQDLMGILWTMRYLLFGIKSEKDVRIIKRGKKIQLENLWLTDTGLAPFFRNIPKEEEEQFAVERIKLLCGFDTKSFARRHRIGRQQYNCDTIAETRPYTHYTDSKRKPWKQFLLESEKEGTISISLSSITYNCKIQTYKILLSALRSHKNEISQRFGNAGGKSFAAAIEQKWENGDWDYVELECQDFLDFITLSLHQMKSVYHMVDGLLSDEDKDLLNWIVSLYTDDEQQTIIVEEHQDTRHEDQTFDGNDSIFLREKRYVTVLNSKLKGSNSEEKDRELPKCLSLLYDELTKEGLIDTTSSKSLFVYRFSGQGEPYPPSSKINWRGKNVLLGHIIRCLLSDARNTPEDMGIAAEFFESKTGKPINPATARYVSVNNYEKERNNLDPNFVEAVELLRRCGFINVEYTTKRR